MPIDRRDLLKLAVAGAAPALPGCRRPRRRVPAPPASSLIFNQRIRGRDPFAVSTDLDATLREAIESGRPLRVLAGGHGYLGSATVRDGLVVDMRPRRGVRIDDQHRLHAQAGARFIDLYRTLSTRFGPSLPWLLATGDCPGVGVAGYTLGGGYGHLSRAWGPLCDSVVGLRAVVATPDGELVQKVLTAASTGEDAELYWALRGGGGARFAVVTDFTFALRERPAAQRLYQLYLAPRLDERPLAEVLRRWVAWSVEHLGDPSVSSKLSAGTGWLHVCGVHEDEARVRSLRDALGPYLDPSRPGALSVALTEASLAQVFQQCESPEACMRRPPAAFAARSAFLSLADVAPRVDAVAARLVRRRGETREYGGLQWMLWRLRPGLDADNAFARRDHDLLCQLSTHGMSDERAPWIGSLFAAVTGQSHNSEALPGYQNYADATVVGTGRAFPAAYHPAAVVARMERVRSRYRDLFAEPPPV